MTGETNNAHKQKPDDSVLTRGAKLMRQAMSDQPGERAAALQKLFEMLDQNGLTKTFAFAVADNFRTLAGAGGMSAAELEKLCDAFEKANKEFDATNKAVIDENKRLRKEKRETDEALRLMREKIASLVLPPTLAPEGAIRDGGVLEFDFVTGGKRSRVFMTADDAARARIITAETTLRGRAGWDKIRTLANLGAVYNDTAIGGIIHPAVQKFDAKTGIRTELKHYQNSQLHDGPDGDPAVQEFNAQTGDATKARRYKDGVHQGELSQDELRALNRRNKESRAAAPAPQNPSP